jgi:hypothetical protein
MITENEIITGERFISFADLVFVNQDKINFHKTLLNCTDEKKFIRFNNNYQISDNDLLRINNISNQILFIYSHHFMIFCQNILPNITTTIKLILHNSDENISDKYLQYLNNPNISRVFAQNIAIEHPKLDYLPIGIANSMWNHGNTKILYQIMNFNLDKHDLVYFNFSNHANRGKLYQILLKNGFIPETTNRPFYQYLDKLAQYKFTFSPEGGGIDCHRTWEALNLGVIPILEKSILADKLVNDYRVLVVEDWNIITTEYLNEQYKVLSDKVFNFNKLNIQYFNDKIKGVF